MDAPADGTADLSFDQIMELERRADVRAAEAEQSSPDALHGADEEPIVLPWWQHPVNIVTLVVTAAILAGMI